MAGEEYPSRSSSSVPGETSLSLLNFSLPLTSMPEVWICPLKVDEPDELRSV